MKKTAILLLTLILLAGICTSAAAITLKIATAAPEGSKWMQEMRAGAEEISLRSQGRVRIKFFAGGVMGNDKSVLRKIRIGQLHGGAFIAGSLNEVAKNIEIYSLPLLFHSYDEVDYVRQRMDPLLKEELERNGFACFGFAEGGFAKIMSSNPIQTIEAVKGLKIWVPEGDQISYRAMQSLGLSPVTLPITDVMTGLQAKLIEVIASSPIGAVAFQWHTKISYITDIPLSYLYGTLAIDKRMFGKLQAADQTLVREVMDRIYTELDHYNRLDNQEALKAMTEQGISIVEATKTDNQRMYDVGRELNEKLSNEGVVDSVLYETLKQHLQVFRSGQVSRSSR